MRVEKGRNLDSMLYATQQAKQWVEPYGSAPKHLKRQQSTGNGIPSMYRDGQRTILIDFIKKEETITGQMKSKNRPI